MADDAAEDAEQQPLATFGHPDVDLIRSVGDRQPARPCVGDRLDSLGTTEKGKIISCNVEICDTPDKSDQLVDTLLEKNGGP